MQEYWQNFLEMTRNKTTFFSRTELKILIYNKMKRHGLTYDQAYKEVTRDIEVVRANHKKKTEKKPNFNEEFQKLTNG